MIHIKVAELLELVEAMINFAKLVYLNFNSLVVNLLQGVVNLLQGVVNLLQGVVNLLQGVVTGLQSY